MIAAAPLHAASPFEDLAAKVKAYIATAQVAAAGGITWAEFGELMTGLLRIAVAALDTLGTMTGAEKKAIALEAVAVLFDKLADRIRVPTLAAPFWLLARPAVKSLVLAIAAGALEQILPLVRLAR